MRLDHLLSNNPEQRRIIGKTWGHFDDPKAWQFNLNECLTYEYESASKLMHEFIPADSLRESNRRDIIQGSPFPDAIISVSERDSDLLCKCNESGHYTVKVILHLNSGP